MKDRWLIIKKYLPWLLLLLGMDVFFFILLWIADVQALYFLSMILTLSSILLFFGTLSVLVHREMKVQEEFRNYISSPTGLNEEALLRLCHVSDKETIQLLGKTLQEKEHQNDQLLVRILDYEEYVEAWAHEIKTPISLLTILLDNHTDEMPENITTKMDYIRNRMQEYVDQMLFYARLKSDKKDYFFEELSLSEMIDDILEDYQPLLLEKEFSLHKHSLDTTVFSDKRGLRFLLGQIISNSIQYTQTGTTPKLTLRCETSSGNTVLVITDNGIGVKPCDFPYIFEKGFTGDSGENRKKATGLGLYLAREFATYLKLELAAYSKWQHGFEIKIRFPK